MHPKKSHFSSNEISPEYAVLGFIYLQPMHGYDLHRSLDTHLCEIWRISQSQVYGILKRLEKKGLISAILQPQEKHPDRACFSATELGRSYFETWLFTPTRSSAHALRVAFISRIFFASHISEGLSSQLVQEQISTIQSDLNILQKRLAEVSPDHNYNRLGLELRVQQLLSILEWLKTCELKRLR